VDPARHAPIVQAGTVILSGPNAESAMELLDLIVSPSGAEVLARYGFGPPGP
jgi:ABC-type molybdate transport system substrate-binding protein